MKQLVKNFLFTDSCLSRLRFTEVSYAYMTIFKNCVYLLILTGESKFQYGYLHKDIVTEIMSIAKRNFYSFKFSEKDWHEYDKSGEK